MPPSADVSEMRKALRQSRNIIAVTGAGLSAASGIPTFRGAGGLWRKHNAMSLATPEAFKKDPGLVWQFYQYRRDVVHQARPNAAHAALAMMQCPDFLHALAPNAKSFTLITQNVDGLSTRALNDVLAKKGDENLQTYPMYEMHGRVFDTLCTECGDRDFNPSLEALSPALRSASEVAETSSLGHQEQTASPPIPPQNLPRCKRCSGLLRPGVVWFGEIPMHMREIEKVVSEADMCLVIGTSSTIYPAANFASDVLNNGGKVAVFNVERTEDDNDVDFLFLAPCEESLPNVLFGSDN